MAVTMRGEKFYLRFHPFRGMGEVGIALFVATKKEAVQVEQAIMAACRVGDYRALDPVSRETLTRIFRNRGWAVPADLADDGGVIAPEALTLWRACKLFLTYPEIRNSPGRWRLEYSLVNLAEKIGKDTLLRSIWVPALKRYQVDRLNDGAAPTTINRDLSALSKLFGIMMELELTDRNPCRMLKPLSKKASERHVYLSTGTVGQIAERCPAWFQRFIWTSFYSGMRRGEIAGLTRQQVNLSRRIITLSPLDTKEHGWKRVPIHEDLVPTIEDALRVRALGTDRVFLIQDRAGTRDLGKDSITNPWPRACEALGLEKPLPRFHDLRHTWRANARRSGVDPTIAETIMGHWTREKTVNELYGGVSDQELLDAIDRMTFDHGETEIWVASGSTKRGPKGVAKDNTRTDHVQNPAGKKIGRLAHGLSQ